MHHAAQAMLALVAVQPDHKVHNACSRQACARLSPGGSRQFRQGQSRMRRGDILHAAGTGREPGQSV